jgi:ABC-2 type transport system permease protein
MLWQKSWWETRWAFPIFVGLGLLLAASQRPWKQYDLNEWISSLQKMAPRLGVNPQELVSLLGNNDGIMWLAWFKGALLGLLPLYAVIVGASFIAYSCPLAGGSRGAAGLFTISLPVSRRRILLTHSALTAIEIFLVVLAPSLFYLIANGLAGRRFSFWNAVIYLLLLALGGMVFLAFSILLAVIFSNQWIAVIIGVAIVIALNWPFARFFEEYPRWNVYHLMSGETYLRYGRIPWLGLLVSLAVSALLMFAAVRIYERRDF